MATALRISVLGDLQALRGSAPLALPQSKKTRALLGYLALTARSHRRTQLCAMFWDGVDDPRGALRWSLSKLRGLLEADAAGALVADRDAVELGGERLAVDYLDVRRTLDAGVDAVPIEALMQAVQQFRGELLDGLDLPDCPDYQAWLVAVREDARRLHLQLLDALVPRLGPTEPEQALPFARARVPLARDDDRSHATLLQLLGAAGKRREADEHYQVHRRWLHERGRKPGPLLLQAWHDLGRPSEAAVTPAPLKAAPVQEIRFCTTPEGVRIAYATSGKGPPLLKTANWLNHLEFDWQSPVWSHWLQALSENHQLVRYDERGNGLSDRDVDDISLDAFVRDLEAVVEAAGLERYPLLGISQGCPVAVAHAVRHPERVTHLVLFGGFAQGWRVRGVEREVEMGEAMMTLAQHGWGQSHPAFRQVFTSLFFPEATSEQAGAFNELQRRASSADNAVRLLRSFGDMDVTHLLPHVRVPTLVLHARRDALIPFAEGRALASGIPGARLVPLESRNHMLLEDEPAWSRFLAEVRAFLASPALA
jgi:pimeloyl-ACP methyl ester carboxylesterase/DNA-binding SARP family transcriptional activator